MRHVLQRISIPLAPKISFFTNSSASFTEIIPGPDPESI